MANLNLTRPPQFTDPWFAEIEQVWDELEAAVNDNDSRITTLETAIVTDVVTSLSKSGDAQLTQDVTLTGSGLVTLTQVGQNIEIEALDTGIDHGVLLGLGDDDHTQYLLASGARALSGNWSVGNFQLTNMRFENLASNPAGGQQGRMIFNTSDLRIKVDNGTSFVDVGVTDHGLLGGLGDDDHTHYLLVDGSRAVTGDLTVNGVYKNEATESFSMESQEDDDGSAVAFILDTANALSTAGALLFSLRNNGVEKFSIDKDGVITGIFSGNLSSLTSIAVLIDTDNDSAVETFTIEKDSATAGGGTLLFEINESGELTLPEPTSGLRIGSSGAPTDALDVDGDADISGELKISLITSLTDLTIRIDNDASVDVAASASITMIQAADADIALDVFNIDSSAIGGPNSTFTEGTDFTLVGGDPSFATGTAGALATAINTAMSGFITASAGVGPNDIALTSDTLGTIGNSITLVYTDNGAPDGASISGALFAGGLDDDEVASLIFQDGASNNVMTLDEAGDMALISGRLAIGKAAPTEALDIIGNILLAGELLLTPNGAIRSIGEMVFQIDTDDDETLTYKFLNGLGSTVMELDEDGDLTIAGTLAGGSSPFSFLSNAANNDGAQAFGTIEIINNSFDSGDSVTITEPDLTAHTFIETTDFTVGGTAEETAQNLTAEISGTGFNSPVTVERVGAVITITSEVPGTVGNQFALAEFDQATDNFTLSGANFTGGTDVAVTAYELDTANDIQVAGSKLFSLLNNSVEKFSIDKDGVISAGASPMQYLSKETDGPTAVAHEMDTVNDLADSDAKLLSLKNQGVEQFFIRADGTSPNFGTGAASGGYKELLYETVQGFPTESNSNPSYAAISGIPQDTLITPVTGPHKFSFTVTGFATSGNCVATFRLVIDKGLAGEVILGDSDVWEISFLNGITDNIVFNDIATLSSGSHTYDLEVKVASNTFNRGASSGYTALTVEANGSGINGLSIEEETVSSPVAITAIAPLWTSTGIIVTFTTIEGERVKLEYNGNGSTSGTNVVLTMGYQLDGITDVPVQGGHFPTGSALAHEVGFSTMTSALSAGTHTIELLCQKASAGSWTLNSANVGNEAILRVIQFPSAGRGAGSILTSSGELTSAKAITSSFSTYEDTGLEVTFDAVAGEVVEFLINASIAKDANTPGGFYGAYKLDSDPDVPIPFQGGFQATSVSSKWTNYGVVIPVTISAAGPHTLKWRAARDAGGDWTIASNNNIDTGANKTEVHVIQHRGSLVPIKSDGSVVTTGPASINYGPEFKVTDNNNEITIELDGGVWTVLPSAGGVGIQTALDAAKAAGGGTVQLLDGTYVISTQLSLLGANNVTLNGKGPQTILEHDGSFVGATVLFQGDLSGLRTNKVIDNPTVGDVIVTTTTPADAGNFIAGDLLFILGVDINGKSDMEVVEVSVDGVPGTGIIEIKSPIIHTMTSAAINAPRNANNLKLSNLSMVLTSTPASFAGAFLFQRGIHSIIENIVIEDFSLSPASTGASVVGFDTFGFNNIIRNIRIRNAVNIGIELSNQAQVTIEDCDVSESATANSGSDAGITLKSRSVDCVIRNNSIRDSQNHGIKIETTSSLNCRRIECIGNIIQGVVTGQGILYESTIDGVIEENLVENALGVHGIILSGAENISVGNNDLNNCSRGITISGGSNIAIEGNVITGSTVGEGVLVQASATDVSIVGNVIKNTAGRSIWLIADQCVVSGNIIRDNVAGSSIYIATASNNVISNNIITGNPANAIELISGSDNNIVEGNIADLIDDQGSGNRFANNSTFGKNVEQIATAVSALTSGQELIRVTNTDAPRTITISTVDIGLVGRVIEIKDESGLAGTNNITIATQGSETIDGVASVAINVNFGSIRLYSNGSNLFNLNAGVDVAALGTDFGDMVTLSGVVVNSTELGTFSGSIITDASDIKVALQELETEIELKETITVVGEIDTNANDLITLSGVAENATDLSTFTGGTVADSETVKGALQDLEDGVETHDHSDTTNQVRLAAKDRRQFAASEKHNADSAAADVTAEHMVIQAVEAVTITKIYFLPDAALTAADTNYATLIVYRRDSSGGTQTTVASITTEVASGSWTAFDGVDLGSLSVSAVAAGEVLTWEITKTSSGIVVPAGTLQIEYTVD